jgi:predicted phage baseplate assembly protein
MVGGQDPETMEQVRQFAPHAFRTQERAVTEADYAEVTQRHPEVQKATATFRWTGSWHTVFITIDRKGGREVDTEFKTGIRRHLEQYRLAGYDIEINGPVFVPLDILIMVCLKDGYLGGEVKQSLLKVFSRQDFADGRQGFFHPDNFTFGQPVYLSQIYQVAMEVAGVASVEVLKFQRWGKTPMNEKEKGFLKPGALEVIRLDNDPNFPENGKIDFEMHGGI